MTKRLLATTAFAIAAMLALFAGSASAQYEPTGSQVLSDTTVRPGDTITVSGTGCPANASVTTTFDRSTVLGSTTAGSDGTFSLSVTIPSDAVPGRHTITSTCGDLVLSSTITVLGASTGTGGSTGTGTGGGALPRTGTNSTVPLTQIGVGLLAIGGVLMIVARKRRQASLA